MTTAPCITVSASSRSSLGSPASTPAAIPTVSSSNQLSQLSRNASVISTSSSSSASSLATTPPSRPRPLRQFSYQPPSRPRSPSEGPNRSRPHSPTTPRAARAPPPVWVPRELGRADSDDSDGALPELVPTSRRGSDARARAHSRKGSASTVRRPDISEPRTHSRSDSASSSGRPVLAPPASPKVSTNLLAGSPKLGPRALVAPGKRSRVPSTASSAAVLAGQLEAVARDVLAPTTNVHASSNLNPNSSPAPTSRHTAPSPTPPPTGPRKRRTQSTSTTGAKARSRSTSAAPRQRQPVSAADFEFGSELGSGSYSTVVKAWFKGNANGSGGAGVMGGLAGVGGGPGPDGKVFAVKVSDKQYLINKGKVKYANVEKTALALLGTGNQHRGHPGIVKLHWTFHDPMSLYFVLDLVPNGELLARIKRLGSLTSEGAKYYTAQIVDAVGWMHGMGVVHRDLKPENILLDEEFRVKITDFGSARVESGDGETNGTGDVPDQRTSSFVGTAEYVSPELLIHNVTSRCSDIWAIGCILFQMLAGRPPFKGGSEYLTLEQVKRLEYVVPEGFDSSAAELVGQILVLEPAARPKMDQIRAHPFLAETFWDEIWTSPAPPMESGPVMGPPPPEPPMDFDSDSDDVGEVWDRMVGGDDEGGAEGGYPGAEGYQAGMAYTGVRAYGMGEYGSVGADGVGYTGAGSAGDGVTPRAVQGSLMFQDYKFGGDVSTVPIPTSKDVAPDERVGERGGGEQGPGSVPVVAETMYSEPKTMGHRSRPSIPPTLPVILSPGLENADNEIAVEDDDLVPELQNMTDQRARMDPLRASHSSTISGAGTTSSSEGSPLGSAIGTARTGSGERMPAVGGEVEGLRIALAVMGLGGDSERLSSALAPGEKPVFMSSILSRPRHRLTAVLPSKRRILILTDVPRLLCVKEQRDRVVVKSEFTFSSSPSAKSPLASVSGSLNGRGRSLARWKQPSTSSTSAASTSTNATPTAEGELDLDPVTSQTVQSADLKGEKSFIVQTASKVFTYVADNSEEAVRWVQQIKAAQQMKRRRSSVLSTRPAVPQ